MGCLCQCGFSSWADNEKNTTGRLADPRSFCIQKTLQDIAHGGPTEQNLMFAGHSRLPLQEGPLLFERLRADGEAARRADPDRRLSAMMPASPPCCSSPPARCRSAPPRRSSRAQTPYWASIASGRAMMRTGPGQNYPGTWLYRPRATCRSGWSRSIATGARSRIRTGPPAGCWSACSPTSAPRSSAASAPRPLHEAPDAASPVRFRAEPGVVGRVSRCAGGWCQFDVRGRGGYIRDRPALGRRAQRDHPLTMGRHASAHARRFLAPGRQGVRRSRSQGGRLPLTLDAAQELPARMGRQGGSFRLEFVGPAPAGAAAGHLSRSRSAASGSRSSSCRSARSSAAPATRRSSSRPGAAARAHPSSR